MKIKKVNTLPQTLEGDTIYFVKGSQVGTMEIYITSDDASEIRTISFAGSFVSSENGEATNLLLKNGYRESEYNITGTTPVISPVNGSIQTWTLSANSTPTAGTWASSQSVLLMVDDGSARTISWTSMGITWKTNTGAAPTLATTGFTPIVLWKVGTVLYGARVGDA